MYFGIDGEESRCTECVGIIGIVGIVTEPDVNGIGCPLTSTPPSEKRRLDAVVGEVGLNLMELNSITRMRLAAPGCLR
jgi:hypothetical protein